MKEQEFVLAVTTEKRLVFGKSAVKKEKITLAERIKRDRKAAKD